MADADDVRRLALALPHVEEIECDGFDFRVGGKGFVWSYPERQPGQRRVLRTDIAVLYVGDEAEKQALLLGEPGLFFTTPGYDGWPLVMLRLAEVDAGRLAELVTDAWRMRAPAELAADFDVAAFEESAAGRSPRRHSSRLFRGLFMISKDMDRMEPCRIYISGRSLRRPAPVIASHTSQTSVVTADIPAGVKGPLRPSRWVAWAHSPRYPAGHPISTVNAYSMIAKDL